MRQVLANLISNAIKYSPQGGRILVRTWTEGDDVLLSVTDEGIGIARQDTPRLFGRFQRLESSAVRGAPGSGLGLYICRCIVAAHGGTFRLRALPHGTAARRCRQIGTGEPCLQCAYPGKRAHMVVSARRQPYESSSQPSWP